MVRADGGQLLPGAEPRPGLARFALDDGRAEEGEKWLREALPIALQIGGWVLLNTYWHLVRSLVAQDRLDDAREIAAFAARSVPRRIRLQRLALTATGGMVATAAGEPAAAAAWVRRGGAAVRGAQLPARPRGRALCLRPLAADVRRGGRRPDELERARSIYARIGADVRRDAVDAELAELVEGPAPAGPSTA